MSRVSKSSSSSSTSRRGLLIKMFRKSKSTHPYSYLSTSRRDSGTCRPCEPATGISASNEPTPNPDSTTLPSQGSLKKDGQSDPHAVFGALSSKYGWGGVYIPVLPSEPAATGKSTKIAGKHAVAQQDVAAPTPPYRGHSSPAFRRQLSQARREQAVVDLSSRYGNARALAISPLLLSTCF